MLAYMVIANCLLSTILLIYRISLSLAVFFWAAEEFKMAIRDLAPCLLFRWLWVIMAGQQQKKRSWRASVECARPVGEKNNGEGGRGDGSRAVEEGVGS